MATLADAVGRFGLPDHGIPGDQPTSLDQNSLLCQKFCGPHLTVPAPPGLEALNEKIHPYGDDFKLSAGQSDGDVVKSTSEGPPRSEQEPDDRLASVAVLPGTSQSGEEPDSEKEPEDHQEDAKKTGSVIGESQSEHATKLDDDDLSTSKAPPVSSGRRSPISALQEFVQSAQTHPFPSSAVVLQWRFDSRIIDGGNSFRAVVAFLLDGIPHHVSGVWKASKVQAKRDAAERLLRLFTEFWAVQSPAEEVVWDPDLSAIDILRTFCSHNPERFGTPPVLDSFVDAEGTRATINLDVYGTMHTFASAPLSSTAEAEKDVAERVLWYVQCPGFENAFEMGSEDVQALSAKIPEPTVAWSHDGKLVGESAEDNEAPAKDAARKDLESTLAFVREAVQQVYGDTVGSCEGKTVWKWTHNFKAKKRCSVQLSRATAHVNMAGKSFTSAWFLTRDKAKLDTCWKILSFLQREHGFYHEDLERIVRLHL